MKLSDTQNKETNSGVYQNSDSTFVLIHGITSKQYKTEKAALKAWSKLSEAGLA